MRVNYKEFASRYKSSGLSRKDFGLQQGMSSSMVSYYLKKAKEELEGPSFVKLDVSTLPAKRQIVIKTKDGLEIQIPI